MKNYGTQIIFIVIGFIAVTFTFYCNYDKNDENHCITQKLLQKLHKHRFTFPQNVTAEYIFDESGCTKCCDSCEQIKNKYTEIVNNLPNSSRMLNNIKGFETDILKVKFIRKCSRIYEYKYKATKNHIIFIDWIPTVSCVKIKHVISTPYHKIIIKHQLP